MGANDKTGQPWSDEELEWLRANYRLLGPLPCAAYLRRSATATARRAFDMRVTRKYCPPPPQELIETLAAKYGRTALCSVNEILSKDRRGHIVWARAQIYKELSRASYSYNKIGKAMGKDHTTVRRGALSKDKKPPEPTIHNATHDGPKGKRKLRSIPALPPNVLILPVAAKPAVLEGEFIRPPSKARLMGCR